jgi:hypothetical protein
MNYKDFLCKYELQYITWNGIEFDKEKLIKFIKRINRLKVLSIFSKSHKEELKVMMEVYNLYDEKKLIGLLNNEPTVSRWALIEKWARIASVDILLNGQYSRQTFTTISNLPIKDYQLILKRIEEMVTMNKSVTFPSDKNTKDIPGL